MPLASMYACICSSPHAAIGLIFTSPNALSKLIDPGERVLTIEDAAELQLHQQHVLRMESRPSNIEGSGAVTIRDLVRNALRMRPDRIVVGEVRGGEVVDLLAALNTAVSDWWR